MFLASAGGRRMGAARTGPGMPRFGYKPPVAEGVGGRWGRRRGSEERAESVLGPSGSQLGLETEGDGGGRAVSLGLARLISSASYSFLSSLARAGVIRSHALSSGSFSSSIKEKAGSSN